MLVGSDSEAIGRRETEAGRVRESGSASVRCLARYAFAWGTGDFDGELTVTDDGDEESRGYQVFRIPKVLVLVLVPVLVLVLVLDLVNRLRENE